MPSFTIVSPLPNAATLLVGGAAIVTINDTSGGTETYRAKLFEFTPGMGSGMQIGSAVNFTAVMGTGSQLSVALPDVTIMGPPPTMGNNREVLVEQLSDGGGLPWGFKLGTQGSGSGVHEMVRLKYCAENQPVPVSLKLKLDSLLFKGTCTNVRQMNKPAILVYSKDSGKWFSPPINLGEKKSPPAYWILEKTDVKTWLLVLQREKTIIVKYRLKTKIPKDCRFPITLERQGPGGRQFTKWPQTATISPA